MAALVGGPGGGAHPESFGKFLKVYRKILKKFQKIHYFSVFFKKVKNPALDFRAFGRKTQLVGEILRKV